MAVVSVEISSIKACHEVVDLNHSQRDSPKHVYIYAAANHGGDRVQISGQARAYMTGEIEI